MAITDRTDGATRTVHNRRLVRQLVAAILVATAAFAGVALAGDPGNDVAPTASAAESAALPQGSLTTYPGSVDMTPTSHLESTVDPAVEIEVVPPVVVEASAPVAVRSANAAFFDTTGDVAGSALTLTPQTPPEPVQLFVYGTCEPDGACRVDVEVANSSGAAIVVGSGRVMVSATCDGVSQAETHLSLSSDVVEAGQRAISTAAAPARWQGACELAAELLFTR